MAIETGDAGGFLPAISFALVMIDNVLEEPRIWEERPNEDAGSS